jgi:pSer/pThr/pTyr-binding forkhead associated (FHA) protein
MRLSFPNGEHADVRLDDGELSIGAAAGNDVSLPSAGLAPRHALLRVDAQRGILLSVPDRNAQVHVNARPVREQAVLRLGDVLSLNRTRILLKPERDEVILQSIPEAGQALPPGAQRTAASRVVLRGVGGSHFGRSVPLCDPVLIGRAADARLQADDPDLDERHAQVELHGERIVLRDLGSHDGSVVNGVVVRDAVLHPGDQLAIGAQRFVIEAPGLPPRGADSGLPPPGFGMGTTQTLRAVEGRPAESAQVARSNLAWLIITAVVIAGVIIAVLSFAPR